jgi:hypothetical protein
VGEDGLDGERVPDDGDDALATATAGTGEDVEIEGHEALERTVGAPQPREAEAQNATPEELAGLLFDEPREAGSVAAVRDFPEKGSRCSRMTVWSTECLVSRG